VFDLDGTLIDSDRALIEPFLRLGVPREEIVLGPLLVDECARLGVSVEAYLDVYDSSSVEPFPGVDELVAELPRWAVASNKVRSSGTAELARLGWTPAAALFAEDFGGRSKQLQPVLDAIGVHAASVVFVGDTDHDRVCADDAGATFALAGWNGRARPQPGDLVLGTPAALLDVFPDLLAG
jgi:phosphoglycolate phosphatase-like HAD superfamily hydrolase